MKIFEFYLNPKVQKYTDYKTFCYEPEKTTERHLGNLCMAGELTNILPPNQKLLQNLAESIKNAHYIPENENSEIAVEHSLQAANKFLETLSRQGNVSWLGNLHFTAVSIAGNTICFSKTGGAKIILIRDGQMTDIGADLENQNVAPYPLRIFPHLITGKIAVQDRIVVLTPDIFHLFEALHIIPHLANLVPGKEEKQLKSLLRPHEKTLREYAGILLLLNIDRVQDTSAPAPFRPRMSFRVKGPMRTIAQGLTTAFSTPSRIPALLFGRIKLPQLPRPPKPKIPKPAIPQFSFKFSLFGSPRFKEQAFLVAALVIILTIGFLLAQFREKQATDIAQTRFLEIQQKVWQAQSALIQNQEKEANNIFQEALSELTILKDTPVKNRAQKLQNEIEQQLIKINKIEDAKDAQVLFALDDPEFSPNKLVRIGDTLYIARTDQPIIYFYNLTSQESARINLEKLLPLFVQINDQLVFYSEEENKLFIPDGPTMDLFPPYIGFSPNDLATYKSFLYFLDAAGRQIIKYRFLENQSQLIPEAWIQRTSDPNLSKALSMTIDGSIWILTKSGQIHRYWDGQWQETLELSLWPQIAAPTKIFTSQSLPYLYILDPPERRIIILDKQGNAIKQYRSEEFNNLSDFAVSQDGKTIYLLNRGDIYKISFAQEI